MTKDTQSRKWQMTINNPVEHGYTHEWIREILLSFKSIEYWCMSDEIGEEETYHTHIFASFSSAVRFSSIKKKFDSAHIEMCRGTSQHNRDYVFKEGKWEKDKKKETNLKKTHEEYGQVPIEHENRQSDMEVVLDMIKEGKSDIEILEAFPNRMSIIDKIGMARQKYNREKFGKIFRELEVTYVYGITGAGKTRSIMEQYGYENVYRVLDYTYPFDSYGSQDVIAFEEFHSSLKIQDMLKYLDGYPVDLPGRNYPRFACYTKVFIVTNIPIEMQYINMQKESKSTWQAFLRRIHTIKEYKKEGMTELPIEEAYWYQDVL